MEYSSSRWNSYPVIPAGSRTATRSSLEEVRSTLRQVTPCIAALEGVDLSAFATDEIAADARDIVQMLGY